MYNIDPLIKALRQEKESGNYRVETNGCISTAISELLSSRLGKPTYDALPDILYNLIKEIIASEQAQSFSVSFFTVKVFDIKTVWEHQGGLSPAEESAEQVRPSKNKTLKDVLTKMKELSGEKYFNYLKPVIEAQLSQAQPALSCGMSACA